MRYEYKIFHTSFNSNVSRIGDALNAAGAEGWRVVDMRWHGSTHDFVTATMERVVEDPPDEKAIPQDSVESRYPHVFRSAEPPEAA